MDVSNIDQSQFFVSDIDKWIHSHIIEIEVVSEENPNATENSSFEQGEGNSYLLENLPKKNDCTLEKSFHPLENKPVKDDCESSEKCDFPLSKVKVNKPKLFEKHKPCDVEADFEFDKDLMQYKCRKCDKYYTHKGSVVHHLRNICGVEPKHKCCKCSYKTKSWLCFRTHMAKHHGDSQYNLNTANSKKHRPTNAINITNRPQSNSNSDELTYEKNTGIASKMFMSNRQIEHSFHDSEASISGENPISGNEKSFYSELEEEDGCELTKDSQPQNNESFKNKNVQTEKITLFSEESHPARGNKPNNSMSIFSSSSSSNMLLKEPKKLIRFVEIKTNNQYASDSYKKTINQHDVSLIKNQQCVKSSFTTEKVNFQVVAIESPTRPIIKKPHTFSCEGPSDQSILLKKVPNSNPQIFSKLDKLELPFHEKKSVVVKKGKPIRETNYCEDSNKPTLTVIKEKERKPRKSRKRPSGVEEYYEFNEKLKKFKCKRCENCFKHRTSVVNHLQNICGVEPKHICHLCPYKTKSKICLKVHVAKLHSGSQLVQNTFPKHSSKPASQIVMSDKEFTNKKKQNIIKVKKDEHCWEYDSDSSLSQVDSMTYSENDIDSEVEEENVEQLKKDKLRKGNEFVYKVKENVFECKTCHQVFKSKGVVALHRHVICSNL